MFFPDKQRPFAEAARVLVPGGAMLFTVWDVVDGSEFPAALVSTAADLLPEDPPMFLVRIPHGYNDPDKIRSDVRASGLRVEAHRPGRAAWGRRIGPDRRRGLRSRDADALRARGTRVAERADGGTRGRARAEAWSRTARRCYHRIGRIRTKAMTFRAPIRKTLSFAVCRLALGTVVRPGRTPRASRRSLTW